MKTKPSKHPNEAQLRDSVAPNPRTPEALAAAIAALVDRPHDYGTCVYAMSLAATAAFNYVAHKLGVSGFQASCADFDILRRTRMIKGGFILLKAEDALYPQCDAQEKLTKFLGGQRVWLRKEARAKLAEKGECSPDVFHHWIGLACFAPCTPEDVKEHNALNPKDQITGGKWYDKNRKDLAFFCAKLAFLREFSDNRNEDFIEHRVADCKRYGLRDINLYRDGNIKKAETCTEAGFHRIGMAVGLEFERRVDGIKIRWSIETEKEGSNGAAGYHFDFLKLDRLAEAAKPQVAKAIRCYIRKARKATAAQ